MVPSRPPPILAIDLARFGCALLVLGFHLTTAFPMSPQATVRVFDPAITLPADWSVVTWFGWVGVEIFFVISGYVIAVSVAESDTRTFLRRRVLRLAPAAWICASIAAALLLVASSVTAIAVLARWTTAIAFMPTPVPIDASYWTLSVEIMFYALVAATLRRGSDVRRLGLVLGLASGSFWLAIVFGVLSDADVFGGFGWPLTLLPHGVFFALGITLSTLRSGRSDGRTALQWLFAAMLATLCTIEVVLHARTMADTPGIVADPAVPAAVFLAGVALIAAADRFQNVLTRTLGPERMTLLGRMTYPLYLLHQTVAAALVAALVAVGVGGGWALAVAAVVTLVAAWIVSERAEPVVRSWLAGRIAALKPIRGPAPDSLRSASLPAG